MPGHPDFQAFPQWIGDPLVSNASLAIGNGSHTDAGLNVSNFASIIVAIKPTGGKITATLKQTIHNGPAALVTSTQWVVADGVITFEQLILQGSLVELDLQGDTGGETVAYAIYGSNTATTAQVSSVNLTNWFHNGVLVKAEPGMDLEDSAAAALPGVPGLTWTATDSAGNFVQYVPVLTAGPLLVTYDQIIANVTVSATTEGTANTVVASTSKTYVGGVPVLVTFMAPHANTGPGGTMDFVLLRDATVLGTVAELQGVVSEHVPIMFSMRDTPSNAAHVYTVKAYVNAGGNGAVAAGAGGAATSAPAFIRVVYDI